MNNQVQTDLTFRHFFFLWFGAAVSMAEILTGGLLAPLGFKNGFWAIITGHAIGVTILALGGIIGSRERLPALSSTRLSFGSYGSYLFSFLNLLQLLGWTAVMIIAAARSANLISTKLWNFDSLQLWGIIIGLLICLWIFSGMAGFKRINLIAVTLLFILTCLLSLVVFKSEKLSASAGGYTPAGWGTGLELNVIMPLSWLPLISDYTRFAKTARGGFWGSWSGYFLGSSWMYLIGLGAAIVSGDSDPTPLMVATGLGISALGIIILATVTTTFLDVYSAGVTVTNIFPKFNERSTALVIGIIGTLIAISVPIEQYENFLYAIGSIFAPLFSILLTDYFFKEHKPSQGELLLNWGAMLVWLLGTGLYHVFVQTEFILGATLPVMILTGLTYLLLRRNLNWKLYQR